MDDVANLEEILSCVSIEEFRNAEPFPHVVIDNFFNEDFLNECESKFPDSKSHEWYLYDNIFEKKLAFNHIQILDPVFANYFNFINSRKFVNFMETLTQRSDLIADPSISGGGLHRIERDGKLDIHADFNFHRVTGWQRRFNMITFLNKDWEEEFRGHCELWDKDMTHAVQRILPIFNRVVIFKAGDDTWHGHPDPLACPNGWSRKSFATYYYSLDHDQNNLDRHSTDYRKRPTDEHDENVERLRTVRRMGRLCDLTTKLT